MVSYCNVWSEHLSTRLYVPTYWLDQIRPQKNNSIVLARSMHTHNQRVQLGFPVVQADIVLTTAVNNSCSLFFGRNCIAPTVVVGMSHPIYSSLFERVVGRQQAGGLLLHRPLYPPGSRRWSPENSSWCVPLELDHAHPRATRLGRGQGGGTMRCGGSTRLLTSL